MGRTVTFAYDANGNLSSVTSPAVTGTPTGNNFANGVTTTYTYNAQHQMTSMTAPDEVMDGGPPRMTFTYDAQGRVTSMTEGGTNSSTVPAGGTMTYSYQTLGTPSGPSDTTTATRQTTAIDRDGNETIYQFNQFNDAISIAQVHQPRHRLRHPHRHDLHDPIQLRHELPPAPADRSPGQHHHLHVRQLGNPIAVRSRATC